MLYKFDQFEIDLDKYELRSDGEVQHIEPLVFDLLLFLVKNSYRVITREELIEEIWQGRIVSDATISTSIKSARRTIKDSGEEQKYIKTIRGRGIEFTARIINDETLSSKPDEKTPKKTKWPLNMPLAIALSLALIALILYMNRLSDVTSDTASYAQPDQPYKVAVLPFADMSEAGNQEYFADGMAEAILNLLASTPSLDMTSRTTAFSLKNLNLSIPEIADRLQVNYIVEGSIRTTGDRVRVTAQLINASNDAHIWSETYDRDLTSIFDVQDDISLAITDALKIELGANARNRSAPTNNMTAYDLYLRGHQLFLNRGTYGTNNRVGYLEESISHLEQATLLDPNFAEAWADLAGVSMVIPTFDGVKYSFDTMAVRSLTYIDRAISLDENLSQAWAAKGFIHLVQLDFADAEASLVRATELRSNNETAWLWLGLTYTTFGSADKAVAAIERAIVLNDTVSVNYNVSGAAAHGAGDVIRAAEYQNVAVMERGFELGRIDTMLIALDPSYQDPRGRRAAATEDAKRYIDFLEKDTNPERDIKLALYVDAHLDQTKRDQATEALDRDIEAREKSAFIGAYLLGDGDRMAKHFRLGTENDGLNLRRVFSTVGRPLYKSAEFRNYLIEIGMLDYWKNNQFPFNCSAVGENGFECH